MHSRPMLLLALGRLHAVRQRPESTDNLLHPLAEAVRSLLFCDTGLDLSTDSNWQKFLAADEPHDVGKYQETISDGPCSPTKIEHYC